MIRSETIKTDFARQVYQGRWAVRASGDALSALEECFLDLRIVDAVMAAADLHVLFNGRIHVQELETGNLRVRVSSPDSLQDGAYEIRFVWRDRIADDLELSFER